MTSDTASLGLPGLECRLAADEREMTGVLEDVIVDFGDMAEIAADITLIASLAPFAPISLILLSTLENRDLCSSLNTTLGSIPEERGVSDAVAAVEFLLRRIEGETAKLIVLGDKEGGNCGRIEATDDMDDALDKID